MDQSMKKDAGKPRLHLVPNELVYGAARAFAFGAKKYRRYGWTAGMEWTRLRDAVERHLRAWTDGEETDPESGLSHLDHAAASLAMLMGHVGRGLGKDDRHCTEPAKPELSNTECESLWAWGKDMAVVHQPGDCSTYVDGAGSGRRWQALACESCRSFHGTP